MTLGSASDKVHELTRTLLAETLAASDFKSALRQMSASLEEHLNSSAADLLGLPDELLARLSKPSPLDFQAIAESLIEGNAAALRELESIARQFGEKILRHLPSNWAQITFGDTLTLAVNYGIPVVDHPDPDTVAAFANASRTGNDPYAVFETRRTEILDDISDLVAIAVADDSPVIVEQARHLEQLVYTLRHKQDLVALGAAASLIDVIIRDLEDKHGVRTTSKSLIDAFGSDALANSTIEELRRRIVLHSAVQTLETFRHGSDPIPERLNRHAVVHTLAPVQYTSRNALWAALLLANLIAIQLSNTAHHDG